MPDLDAATFFGGVVGGRTLLALGLVVCLLGLAFGLISYVTLRRRPLPLSLWASSPMR